MSGSGQTTIEPTLRRWLKWNVYVWMFGLIIGVILTEIAERTDWFQGLGSTVWNGIAAHPVEALAIFGIMFVIGFVANKIIK